MKKVRAFLLALSLVCTAASCGTPTKADVSVPSPVEDASVEVSTYTPTTGQQNALETAKAYLSVMPFSYDGLVDQLEYEQYTNQEAVYAASRCGADWKEQAVKCAESYLSHSSFSKKELIEQLEYEGFTHEQAVYGISQNGY